MVQIHSPRPFFLSSVRSSRSEIAGRGSSTLTPKPRPFEAHEGTATRKSKSALLVYKLGMVSSARRLERACHPRANILVWSIRLAGGTAFGFEFSGGPSVTLFDRWSF